MAAALSISILAFVAAGSWANPGAREPARSSGTAVPESLLERPVPLRHGIGNSHEAVSTRSPEAQAFFDQGLDYLEGYVWIEAARSFHQALRLDPDLAMAYVGLSRTASGLSDRAAARNDLTRAKSLASKASPRERRRIALREKQLIAMDDPKNSRKFLAYKQAIDDALRLDAEPGLWLLRGNAEEPDASGRGQYGTEASIIYYRHILTLVPDYASAHHFLAHTYEGLGQIDSALAHGEAYSRLAPAIPHAAHMWGHALRRAARAKEAIAQFERADSLERAYYASEHIDPTLDWHHAHNLALLASMYRGNEMRSAPAAQDGNSVLDLEKKAARARTDGRWKEAERDARAMIDIDPGYAGGHRALAQVFEHQGRESRAALSLDLARRLRSNTETALGDNRGGRPRASM
ncbi:MAG TPA: hypothetical protein VGQ14_03655 [Candidatus Eisenbacteria bacterium]|nr:hypothetical protein [Candidatus Eisenbacteria bacterium]